jgi:DNA-binding GntR family transcriptional regulator
MRRLLENDAMCLRIGRDSPGEPPGRAPYTLDVVVTVARSSDPPRDVIADALRVRIMSGQLKPGERLREDAVAEEFGVSRVPVREALRRLESEGFINLTPYRGATVSETSQQDSLELMQVRRGLETMAARLAAQSRGGAVAGELIAIVDRGREAGRHEQLGELPPLIMQFHELVARASGNRQLEQMLERVLQRISWGFELDLQARIGSSWADHSAIASAIVHGSPLQAALLMDEHIEKDELLYRQKYAQDV